MWQRLQHINANTASSTLTDADSSLLKEDLATWHRQAVTLARKQRAREFQDEVEEACRQGDAYLAHKTLRKLRPWQPQTRAQLQSSEGSLLTPQEELTMLETHVTKIFAKYPQLNRTVHSLPDISGELFAAEENSVSNIQSSSYLLEFVARAYQAIPPGLFDSFELPDPNQVECLSLAYAQCITLDLLPWVQIVRQSYSRAFYQREVAPAWTVEALEEFVFVMLDDPDEYLLDQFMGFLIEPIESSDVMLAVFRGDAPYTNENLKKLAAAGSSYFDTLYYQITAMYGLQTSSTQDLPAPNNSFVIVYDTFLQLCENISDGHAMLARHWNNKGNSMEACTLLLAESARWPPRGASREAAGSSFSDTEKCPAFSTGHPTTTLTVRHTYNMAVCKTPDATTLTVYHTYIMRAMSPGSQAVTNTAVLTGDASKIEGSDLPAPVTGASTAGWRADETPAEILGYSAAPSRIPP
eukprot:s2013_g12.t1